MVHRRLLPQAVKRKRLVDSLNGILDELEARNIANDDAEKFQTILLKAHRRVSKSDVLEESYELQLSKLQQFICETLSDGLMSL